MLSRYERLSAVSRTDARSRDQLASLQMCVS